jgi:hypothetical protein
MNETPELKPNTTEAVLKQAEAAKDLYVAAISNYPNLKVSARLINPGQYPKWNVQVHSANEVNGDRYHDTINFEVDSVRWVESARTLAITRFTAGSRRGAKRHYKSFDAAKAKKVAKEVSELEQQWVEGVKKSMESKDISGQWQVVRRQALQGFAIHPCLTVSIVESGEAPTQSDKNAPKFVVDFTQYCSNKLGNYRLTLDQVARVAAVISEVTGLDKAFAIVQRSEQGVAQWDGAWFHLNTGVNRPVRAKIYATREEADAELTRIQSGNAGNVTADGTTREVVPFSQLM